MHSGTPGRLLQSLAAITTANSLARKRLVGPDADFGRELLQQLARETSGWLGWESTTLASIACDLAFVPLSESGERVASSIEIAALVNEALDASIDAGTVRGGFAALARGLGFRHVLRDSLLHARTGGVTPAMLRDAAGRDPSALAMAAILERYETLLAERHVADQARVLRVALDAFDAEAPFVLDGITTLVPSLPLRGLAGELLARLVAGGAIVLDADATVGVEIPPTLLASRNDASNAAAGSLLSLVTTATLPCEASDTTSFDASLATVDLFAAATPAEEVREVLRRAVAEGLAWDDIEIVATDTAVYGIALDALCTRLDVSVTMSRGLPLARTRLGRALERWFAWIESGLPADTLREALEAGELASPVGDVGSARLASELRRLGLGWGRDRYTDAIARLTSGDLAAAMRQGEDESPDDFATRVERKRETHAALAALLTRLLSTLPAVPERGSDAVVRASVDRLARATADYLSLVDTRSAAEIQTKARLVGVLEELATIPVPETGFGSALAALKESVAGLAAWPLVTSERKPWSSAGGAIHLTDLQHAGVTGRKRVFVVGLDAERTRGGTLQDPILSDGIRAAIGGGRMATSAELAAEWEWKLGAALAGLRGRVTLSYATSAALDGREAGPAPLLLQAYRLIEGDRTISFKTMRERLLPPACAVPSTTRGMLDARDVWLETLAEGPLLLDGTRQTRESFTPLAAGLAALDAAASANPSGYHGLVPDAADALDPVAGGEREISPSSLERLASCPMAWFYRYGLELYEPGDPQYDEDRWLDAMQRGNLLHEVFESFGVAYLHRQDDVLLDSATAELDAIVAGAIARWRALVPPPSEMTFASECDALRSDARVFLDLEREARRREPGARWLHIEFGFGRQHDGAVPNGVGTFTTGQGHTIRVGGRADRVDRLPDGTLRVIDFKTGSSERYARSDAKTGAFKGGRQLQPALYAASVGTVTGTPVGSFEYRFPTARGKSAVVTYGSVDFLAARGIVDSLLGHVQRGEFVSTDDPADCAYCEYAGVCRAHTDSWRNTSSPRAEWAKEHGGALELYTPMRARRGAMIATGTAAAAEGA